MAMSDRRLEIQRKQRELRVQTLRNKVTQFEIKELELEDELERIRENKRLSEAEIDKILNPPAPEEEQTE